MADLAEIKIEEYMDKAIGLTYGGESYVITKEQLVYIMDSWHKDHKGLTEEIERLQKRLDEKEKAFAKYVDSVEEETEELQEKAEKYDKQKSSKRYKYWELREIKAGYVGERYKYILESRDKGKKRKDIIGSTVTTSNGEKHTITKKMYDNAMKWKRDNYPDLVERSTQQK